MDETVYSGTQEQIGTMLILMKEKLPVVRDLLTTLIIELLHGGKICSNYPQERLPSYLSRS